MTLSGQIFSGQEVDHQFGQGLEVMTGLGDLQDLGCRELKFEIVATLLDVCDPNIEVREVEMGYEPPLQPGLQLGVQALLSSRFVTTGKDHWFAALMIAVNDGDNVILESFEVLDVLNVIQDQTVKFKDFLDEFKTVFYFCMVIVIELVCGTEKDFFMPLIFKEAIGHGGDQMRFP